MWVRIPLETYIFILNFSLPPRSEQVNGSVANEIKHVHSPEVIVVLDSRYDLSYKVLYISTCSIALTGVSIERQKRTSVSQTKLAFLATRNMTRTNVGLALSYVKLLLSSWKTYMFDLKAWYINKQCGFQVCSTHSGFIFILL